MHVPPAEVARGLPTQPTHQAWRDGIAHITERADLWPRLWEINRAVAEAYGLDADDFEHILAAFPVLARKRKEFLAYLGERVAEWKADSEPARFRVATRSG
jgi:hypothetical protein